jgi:hypothetical protein
MLFATGAHLGLRFMQGRILSTREETKGRLMSRAISTSFRKYFRIRQRLAIPCLMILLAPFLELLLSLPGYAQAPPGPPPSPAMRNSIDNPYFGSLDQNAALQVMRIRSLNLDRQKKLVSDTNKLLRMANELSAELSNSHSDSFTPDQLHKLGEIEKLAHNVREKMKNPVLYVPTQPSPYDATLR